MKENSPNENATSELHGHPNPLRWFGGGGGNNRLWSVANSFAKTVIAVGRTLLFTVTD